MSQRTAITDRQVVPSVDLDIAANSTRINASDQAGHTVESDDQLRRAVESGSQSRRAVESVGEVRTVESGDQLRHTGRSGNHLGRESAAGLEPDLLIAYFNGSGRDLPWRRPTATPWSILISEVMLQQTPVNRVLPAYREWVHRWPSPADLAADSPAAAIRAWGRLGYPRRALRLHAAATTITAEHSGVVPASVEALLKLPGVGEYTARAVAAFAFGVRTPVVDTNVRRVMSRVLRGIDEPRATATAADRTQMAMLLPDEPSRAARFSAAVMELGALVCTARTPTCATCPLVQNCSWHRAGRPAGLAKRPAQTWHGTDRQVRGRILATLRASPGPVAAEHLAELVTDTEQNRRCIDSLLADGLVVRVDPDHLGLPD